MEEVWTIAKVLVCLLMAALYAFAKSDYCPTLRRFIIMQRLPGPKGVWLLGNAPQISRIPLEDSLQWFSNEFSKYSRLMRFWVLGQSSIYIREPDDVQDVFNNGVYIDKGLVYQIIQPWLGEGLLTSSGDKWHSRRKLLTPAFHFKILEENLIAFNKSSNVLCEKIASLENEDVGLDSIFTLCTLDIIMKTAMGVDLNAQSEGSHDYVRHLKKVSHLMTIRILRPQLFLNWIFNLSNIGREFYRSLKFLHNYSYRVIGEKRKEYGGSLGKYRAFLDTLLEHDVKNPGLLSDKDIREEVDTFMFEGHDTTSAALIFIFYNLSKYPEIQQKVYQEVVDILGDGSRDMTPGDLSKMVYMEMFIKETLRLYPSVPLVTRRLRKDFKFRDGLLIPARTSIVAPIYLIHRNDKHWDDPLTFDPERFSEARSAGRHPYAYIPFSAGPRNCIGQKFAMMELKTVMARVIQRFRVAPPEEPHDFKVIISLILRTNRPIKCRFVPRTNSDNPIKISD